MWPPITIDDLKKRHQITGDEAEASERLKDAEAQLRAILRDRGVVGVPAFLTPEEQADWTRLYVATVTEAVRRFLLNPEGWLEERTALDDWDRTRRRDAAVSTGKVTFAEEDIAMLVPTRRRRGAFSIRPM